MIRRLIVALAALVVARLFKRPKSSSRLTAFSQRYDGHTLTLAHEAQLSNGHKVLFSQRDANAGGGRGTAVCDVAAPPARVWNTILGFDQYAGRLAQCKYSKVYERKRGFLKETIKVHMKLDALIRDFNCFYVHTYQNGVLTWTLDPDHISDFLDVQGQWCVDAHPSKPNWSRVWYSADVKLPPWLPRPVVVQMCKTSGTKALDFCKRGAERG